MHKETHCCHQRPKVSASTLQGAKKLKDVQTRGSAPWLNIAEGVLMRLMSESGDGPR